MKRIFTRSLLLLFLVTAPMSCWMPSFCSKDQKGEQKAGQPADTASAGAPKSVDELNARIQKLELENEQIKDLRERERFRVQEMEKKLAEMQNLRSKGNEQGAEIARLTSELKAAREEIATLKDRLSGAKGKYRLGECVRWFGGLGEGKKSMKGLVKIHRDNSYMVQCTETGAPYLYAVGEIYQFNENQLLSCGSGS